MKNKDWVHQQQSALLEWLPISRIREITEEHGTPIQIISRSRLRERAERLRSVLPMVDHYFAVKALPSDEALIELNTIGFGFDVASGGEIEQLLRLSVKPEKMIHTHPIKREKDISDAVTRGIKVFVFDSIDELEVLEKYKDKVELLLRLSFRTDKALIDLSYKFGALPEESLGIIKCASERGFRVVGLSFHAGSQLESPEPMLEACKTSLKIIHDANSCNIQLKVLDIGGGFPAPYTIPIYDLEGFCKPIAALLKEARETTDLNFLSEAGRVVCAPAAVAVSKVMGTAKRPDGHWLYLDDGIYGSYSGILFEHGEYHIWSLKELSNPEIAFIDGITLAGPTCDSIDVIARQIAFPQLSRDDIVVSPNMGAYSWATSTSFNAFPIPKLIYID